MAGPILRNEPETPYCSHCGYDLTGLTESSKCPECGKPLVEVLVRRSFWGAASRRYTSPQKVFGLPLLAIATGPAPGERMGKAVGFIAVGDYARGVFALGGVSVGIFSMGGLSAGVFSFGGCSLGAAVAVGGLAVGLVAVGGCAVGGWAIGGLCLYLIRGWGGGVIPLWP